MPYRTAWEAGHKTLYHYEKFCEEWLTETLRSRTLHCSNPLNFNDPWDYKPTFDDRSFETQAQIDTFVEYLHGITSQPKHLIHQSVLDAGMYRGPAAVQEILAGLSASNAAYLANCGIYCLTPDPCSILMWSHYAENHKGICLEFNIFNTVFMTSLEVTYRSQYPIWTPYSATEENAVEMALTKAADWYYEKEFRVIARSEVDAGHPLRLHGHRIRLPENALASVVVGCEGDYQAIHRIVDQHAPGLPVRRIKRVPNHYKLIIENLTDSASTP